MLRILNNGRSAMIAQQEKLDAISNNIANVNTEGYKRMDVSFQDLVNETLQRKGYPVTENGQRVIDPSTGTGVKATDPIRDDRQGSLEETNTKTDLAIDGPGFFRVTLRDGSKAYTRNGSFNVDGAGNLVDKNGNKLDYTAIADFKFSGDNFAVLDNGEIRNTTTDEVVGKIDLYNVRGQDSLKSIGSNLYQVATRMNNNQQVPTETPFTVKDSNIKQGYVEMSNVDVASEMADMIMTQRAFELGSRGIKTADDMWGMVNNLRGK